MPTENKILFLCGSGGGVSPVTPLLHGVWRRSLDFEIVSRQEARNNGFTYFFTGDPCSHGHVCQRLVSSGKCTECLKIRKKRYYEENSKKIIEKQRRYYSENRDAITKREREYYQLNRESILKKSREYNSREEVKEKQRQWRSENKEYRMELHRKWRKENPESVSKIHRRWYEKNRERKLAKTREWYENNREKYNEAVRDRYNNNPDVKLATFIRKCLRKTLIGDKDAPSFEAVGYTPEELRKHIENQFVDGMDWSNHGTVWHIDHIAPVSYLIKNGETDPSVINALDNLRPLWAEENLSKGAKYDPREGITQAFQNL